jgi:hypothetical protein
MLENDKKNFEKYKIWSTSSCSYENHLVQFDQSFAL